MSFAAWMKERKSWLSKAPRHSSEENTMRHMTDSLVCTNRQLLSPLPSSSPAAPYFSSWPWCFFFTKQTFASHSTTSQTPTPPLPEECQFVHSHQLKWAEITALLSVCEGGRVTSSNLIKSNYHMTHTLSWIWCTNSMSHVTDDLV